MVSNGLLLSPEAEEEPSLSPGFDEQDVNKNNAVVIVSRLCFTNLINIYYLNKRLRKLEIITRTGIKVLNIFIVLVNNLTKFKKQSNHLNNMKPYHRSLLTLMLLFCSVAVFAQDKDAQVKELVKQGTALHDAKKYDEAIAKYDEALKIDPGNNAALFEKGFSLASSGKTDQATIILEKVAASNTEPSAYDVLGSIYDDKKDFDKAVGYFQKGINSFPKYQRLRYNISISYLRQKKYPEAEAAATEAIKLNPKHASSHRAYAIATYNEGKHVNSIMAWCNFLIIEPQTQRSTEALTYIKHMLYLNVKENTMKVGGTDELTTGQQLSIALAVSTGLTISKNADGNNSAKVSSLDSLTSPLPAIFRLTFEKEEPTNTLFFKKYYAKFFSDLANSGYMQAFGRYITISAFENDNIAWLKEHQDNLNALTTWVNTYKRETE